MELSELSHTLHNWIPYYCACHPCSCNTLFSCQVTEWTTQFTLAFRAPLILFQWRSNVVFWVFFSYWVLAESESPEAFVCGPCRAALTAVLTFIKGHPFLECKSTTLLVTSLHLPAVLVNICNSTTGNTSGTGKVLKNKICFMVLKKKKKSSLCDQ